MNKTIETQLDVMDTALRQAFGSSDNDRPEYEGKEGFPDLKDEEEKKEEEF